MTHNPSLRQHPMLLPAIRHRPAGDQLIYVLSWTGWSDGYAIVCLRDDGRVWGVQVRDIEVDLNAT